MLNFRKVLAIGAHPDDIEFSCFGYLSKLKSDGAEIAVYIASNGCIGDPSSGSHRIQESKLALCELAPQFFSRDSSGIGAVDHEPVSKELREIILKFKPDLVLVHSQYDTHQEHVLLRAIAVTALRRVPTTLMSYKSVSVTAEYKENVFIDVSDYIDAKLHALMHHESQSHHPYLQSNAIKNFHINWFAHMRGIELAESYYLEQMVG